jgi:hypothetical protein
MVAVKDGGVLAKSGVVYGPNGTMSQMNPFTYSWPGNAYRTGSSVEQVIASQLDYALSSWAFQGGNQSGNNSAHFRKDSIANNKVAKILTKQLWQKFAASHCQSVLGNPQGMLMMIPSYSLQVVQTKQAMTNYYDIGNPGVGALTLKEVTAGGDRRNVTLTDYITGLANAATANRGYDKQTAVVMLPSVLTSARPEFVLVHETLFHAYAGLIDDSIFGNSYFNQQGLWREPGSTATTSISTWMSTDCRCTPGNPATPSCQANTATW